MFDILFIAMILVCGVVVVRDSHHSILKMDRTTRNTIRASYVLVCAGAAVLVIAALPSLRHFLLGGAAMLLTGVCGLILFNKRRIFERDEQDRTLVLDEDEKTQFVRRAA